MCFRSVKNSGIGRCIICFITMFLISIIFRFPSTTGMELARYYNITISSCVVGTGILYLWGFKRYAIFNIFAFTVFYVSIEYIKLLDGMKLPTQEIVSSFGVGTFLFCLISLSYYVNLMIPIKIIRSITGYILYVFYITLLLPPLLLWGYYISSSHLLTSDIVLTLFQTNLSEAAAYLISRNIFLWLCGGFAIIVVCVLCIISFKKMQYVYHPPKIVLGIGIVIIYLVLTILPKSDSFYVINIIKHTYQTLQNFKEYGNAKTEREKRLQQLDNLTIAPGQGGIYVLVIGESETRDHMQVYGYSRQNTPWLEKFSKEPGSILFSHAYSNHTHTVPVLTYALSEKNQYNTTELVDAYSIMEIAKAAGYNTYWISNQQKYGAWDTPIAEIASTANHEVWLNGNVGKQTETFYNDGKLIDALPDLDNVQNAFIVVHLMGSHEAYDDRYPKEFEKFSGSNKRVDAYDNSILYNDYVLREIYEKIHTYPNFKAWFYFSDHGDDPDHGFGHEATKFTYKMSHIPFIINLSPAFIDNRPDTFQTLQQHQDLYWTNDLLYDVLVDVMDIQGVPQQDTAFDIASTAYNRTKFNLTTLHGSKNIADDQ